MKYIALEVVLDFHKKIVVRTGGSTGIRDLSLIESALGRAFITFDGQDLFITIEEKIAATTYSLIKNHGFVDGNKRIGIAVMLLLLKINSINIKYTQQELIDLGLGVADGTINEKMIEVWVKRHMNGCFEC
jgi:death-on-curing protein